MRRSLLFLLLVLASSALAQTNSPKIAVYFSPDGGCTAALVDQISKAKLSILVQAYNFTSAPIAGALKDATKRKVNVQVILDKGNVTDKYSVADFLLHASIPTRIDSRHAIAHNKVMVIDRQVVITGSMNFTKAGESSNAENVLVIQDAALAEKYIANWLVHYKHSDAYQGK